MQSKNAIGNLKNRYAAVLKKCCLLNVFGSLVIAGMCVVGASAAQAQAVIQPQTQTQALPNIADFSPVTSFEDLEEAKKEAKASGSAMNVLFAERAVLFTDTVGQFTFGDDADMNTFNFVGGYYGVDLNADGTISRITLSGDTGIDKANGFSVPLAKGDTSPVTVTLSTLNFTSFANSALTLVGVNNEDTPLSVNISNSTFSQNNNGTGGAINSTAGKLKTDKATGLDFGGDVNLTISNSYFFENSAGREGGALHSALAKKSASAISEVIISDSAFVDNIAGKDDGSDPGLGGAVFNASEMRLENSVLFSGNQVYTATPGATASNAIYNAGRAYSTSGGKKPTILDAVIANLTINPHNGLIHIMGGITGEIGDIANKTQGVLGAITINSHDYGLPVFIDGDVTNNNLTLAANSSLSFASGVVSATQFDGGTFTGEAGSVVYLDANMNTGDIDGGTFTGSTVAYRIIEDGNSRLPANSTTYAYTNDYYYDTTGRRGVPNIGLQQALGNSDVRTFSLTADYTGAAGIMTDGTLTIFGNLDDALAETRTARYGSALYNLDSPLRIINEGGVLNIIDVYSNSNRNEPIIEMQTGTTGTTNIYNSYFTGSDIALAVNDGTVNVYASRFAGTNLAIDIAGGTVNIHAPNMDTVFDAPIQSNGTINIYGASVGEVVLNADMSEVHGTVNLESGTIRIGENIGTHTVAGETYTNFFRGNFVVHGGMLNAVNGQADTFNITNWNTSASHLPVLIDVDFTNREADYFQNSSGQAITIAGINMIGTPMDGGQSINITDDGTNFAIFAPYSYTATTKYEINDSELASNGRLTFNVAGANPVRELPGITANLAAARMMATSNVVIGHTIDGTGTGGINAPDSGNDNDEDNVAHYQSSEGASAGSVYLAQTDDLIPATLSVRNPEDDYSWNVWAQPYASFETINYGAMDVEVDAFGILAGATSRAIDLGASDLYLSAYVGFNSSNSTFDEIDNNQYGGLVGASISLYHGNFYIGATANAGISRTDMENNNPLNPYYTSQTLSNLTVGFAAKSGYNFNFLERYTVQPNIIVGVNYVNTNDYINNRGESVVSEEMLALQITPGVRFSANFNTADIYAEASYSFLTGTGIDFKIDDDFIAGQEIDDFASLTLGASNVWDNFAIYGEVIGTLGGRDSIGAQAGFELRF